MKKHHYECEVTWEGNLGSGTSSYTAYSRDHKIQATGKSAPVQGSADPSFRGDPQRYNPEELFISSLSSCHMLWYLHLCSANGIKVLSYTDHPQGIMQEEPQGGGRFISVILRPEVEIENDQDTTLAMKLHEEAGNMCFIASSCNFKIEHSPSVRAASTPR